MRQGNSISTSSFSGIDHLLRHLLAGAGIFLPFSQKRLYKRVQQVYSAYGSGNAIGWDVSADINQYTDWVMQTIYLRRTESNIKSFMEDTRRLGMCMQRVCKKIIEQGYAGVIEVNQLHLAYRNAAVLLAIYGDLSEFEKSYELLDRSTYAMARHYRDTTSSHVKQLKDAEDELRNFLISERDYKIEEKVDLTEYRDDSKLYSLLKATWIGDYLTVMANLREMLEHRRRKEEQDLFELLDE